jgi:hypothetical protein
VRRLFRLAGVSSLFAQGCTPSMDDAVRDSAVRP